MTAALNAAALRRFLFDDGPRCPDGRVPSWLGEGGFPYDESTILLARLAMGLGNAAVAGELKLVVGARLESQGWLGRDGVGYTFDTSLALGVSAPPDLPHWIASWLAEARATTAPVGTAGLRWSQRFGPHLIKAAAEAAPFGYADLAQTVARALVLDTFQEGRFRTHPGATDTYVHAHCYALEGLVTLGGHDATVRAGLDFLEHAMAPDGSLPAWIGRADPRRPTDAVAQAVRLFAAVAPRRYAAAIESGLGYLGRMQVASGGLHYTPECTHVNLWASIFALDAISWISAPSVVRRFV